MSILTDAPTVEFCEKAGSGILARPFYAISNLPFLIISVLILRKSKNLLALLFAATVGLVGLFSFIYDAAPSRLTQLIDLTGMFLIISALITVNITRLRINNLRNNLIVLPIITFISSFITYFLKGISGNIIFGLLVLTYIFSELYLKKENNLKEWLGAFLIFATGFIIWLFDFKNWYCLPGNYLNGRGVFHILTAISIYLLYKYYAFNQEKFGLK